jgi:class 3 adenylate cyclase/TolB-like protein/Flp pilus assembly protein TadD
MTETSLQYSRKLAAVMFTDISSFSQKLAENESSAMALLKSYDGLMRILSMRFGGRVLKCVGDLFMIDFKSSVNAVRCAVEAQQRFWTYNQSRPQKERIEIRSGIHMGDVLVQDDNIVGECVTLASLIEALAEPNRILISHDIYQQIKNKLPYKVFSLGPLSFSGMPEKTEVYEILIDDIPELAVPSSGSLLIQEKHQVDPMLHPETEEAQHVEQIRQKVLQQEFESEKKRKKELEYLYAKAEKSVQRGNLDEAEKTLKEALKLNAPAVEVQAQAPDPKEAEAQKFYANAKDFVEKGALQEAEDEAKKIFQIYPLHLGAQQLLLQIDDIRQKQEKAERADSEQKEKPLDENEQKIAQLLETVRDLIEREEFQEAMFKLRELYLINPNHQEARLTEVALHEAERARGERLRNEAIQAEEVQRQLRLERIHKELKEKRERKTIARQKKHAAQYSRRTKKIIASVIGLLVLAGAVIKAIDYYFPKTASIAVVRFTSGTLSGTESDLLKAFPKLLADDISRCEHITVAAPFSTLSLEPSAAHLKTIARTMQAQYIVTGSIEKSQKGYFISCSVVDQDDHSILCSLKMDAEITDFYRVQNALVESLIKNLDLRSAVPVLERPTASPEAYDLYLRGVAVLPSVDRQMLQISAELFESALRRDRTLSDARLQAAACYYQLFDLTLKKEYLSQAEAMMHVPMQLKTNDPLAASLAARSLRYAGSIRKAKISIDEILRSAPSFAPAHEENVSILLREGKEEEAFQQAKILNSLDPRNPKTLYLLGLTSQFKHADSEAVDYYGKSIRLGYPDAELTLNLISQAQLNCGKTAQSINYYKEQLRASPNDYRLYYKIGQAHQWATQIETAQRWLKDGLTLVKEILDKNPLDAQAHAGAALFLSRLGEFSDGQAEINRALAVDSTNTEILFYAADMYSIQKNKPKALAFLKKALASDYRYAELLNIDLSFVAGDPDFRAAITSDASKE